MQHLSAAYSTPKESSSVTSKAAPKVRRTVVTRVQQAIKAIALCHNVTPVYEDSDPDEIDLDQPEADQQIDRHVTYQASSPDEVCVVLIKIWIIY